MPPREPDGEGFANEPQPGAGAWRDAEITEGVAGTITLATATGLGRLPTGVTKRHIAGLGLLGALGFIVALFITELAYPDPAQTAHAKLGILTASIIATVGAAAVLAVATPATET